MGKRISKEDQDKARRERLMEDVFTWTAKHLYGLLIAAVLAYGAGLMFGLGQSVFTPTCASSGPGISISVASTTYSGTEEIDLESMERLGECGSEDLKFSFGVYRAPELLPGDTEDSQTLGMWIPGEGALVIFPNGESIDTVSHEVSHAVDSVMAAKGLYGTEAEAYLQGSLTECVSELVGV